MSKKCYLEGTADGQPCNSKLWEKIELDSSLYMYLYRCTLESSFQNVAQSLKLHLYHSYFYIQWSTFVICLNQNISFYTIHVDRFYTPSDWSKTSTGTWENRHLRNVEKTCLEFVFSTFPPCSQMPLVTYRSVIHSSGFFICQIQLTLSLFVAFLLI